MRLKDSGKQEVMDYLHSVMRRELKDEQVIVLREDNCTRADIISTQVSIKDSNMAAKLLADIYGLVDNTQKVTVQGSEDVNKLHQDLLKLKKGVTHVVETDSKA